MKRKRMAVFTLLTAAAGLQAQPAPVPGNAPQPDIAAMVKRLDLERFKSLIKGLTQFGDRRQGTARNRASLDWIEAQLKEAGCANIERLHYEYQPPAAAGRGGNGRAAGGPNVGPGGARRYGNGNLEVYNQDPMKQPDPKLRALDSEPTTPGPREDIYCTKVGAVHPEEAYIVSAHFDGQGYGEAADDDGSGVALVIELARIFGSPDVMTDRSIRFVLWNNEETGSGGARAYIEQRRALQGIESPAGSGKYPEPKWLGMIQHDMILFDHGMPLADGSIPKKQRPEADINVEYQYASKLAEPAMILAHKFQLANDKYAERYPVSVGLRMTNTDSGPFMDIVPSISIREVERGSQMGFGWSPHHHQPTDLYANLDDDDFRLGLNTEQTTLSALAELTGAKLKQ
jgi:hypothetical protein